MPAPVPLPVCPLCGWWLGEVPQDDHMLTCPGASLPHVRLAERGPAEEYEDNLRIQRAMGGRVLKAVRDVDLAAPKAPRSPDALCAICMEEPSPEVRRGRRCGHEFCPGCLEQWLSRSTTCPVCVADLSVDGGHRLVDEYPEQAGEAHTGRVRAMEELLFHLDTIQSIVDSIT